MELMSNFYPETLFIFILLTVYQAVVTISADILPVYIFLKRFCFLFSQSSRAHYSCSFFYFNPQYSQFSLGFAFTHSHNIFSILCLILFYIQPGEEHSMPLRMKRLLELIFIFCAMPMAFSECVMCYHQVLIMQLK